MSVPRKSKSKRVDFLETDEEPKNNGAKTEEKKSKHERGNARDNEQEWNNEE